MYSKIGQIYHRPLEMDITTTLMGNSSDPDIFGPPFWFVLHNAAVGYYENPTATARNMMKSFLYSIPVLIPCTQCKEHAYDYLRNQDLDHAVASRGNLFKFMVNFHNCVNEKTGLVTMTLEEAKSLYGFYNYGQGGAMKITYH